MPIEDIEKKIDRPTTSQAMNAYLIANRNRDLVDIHNELDAVSMIYYAEMHRVFAELEASQGRTE